MTAASEARRIALMLNDSKWQEIEEEIRKAIEAAWCPISSHHRPTEEHFCRRGGIVKGSDVGCCAGLPDPQFAWHDVAGRPSIYSSDPDLYWRGVEEKRAESARLFPDATWRDQPDGVR